MANFVTIEAEARAGAGKGAARATRRAGKVPGVIYGAKIDAALIMLEPKAVMKELVRGGWSSRLYEVKVGGEITRALMRAVQFHPVTDQPEHVDFQRLAPGEMLRVSVSVSFINDTTSPGIKRGGVLNVVRHAIECLCDPEAVPDHFEADLGALDINGTVRWSNLKGTDASRPTTAGDFIVATIAPPTKSTEAPAEAAAATPAKAAPAKAATAKAAPKPAAPKKK